MTACMLSQTAWTAVVCTVYVDSAMVDLEGESEVSDIIIRCEQ